MARPRVGLWSRKMAPEAFRILKDEVVPTHRPITYGDLARRLGIHHRPLRFVLGQIWDWCERNGHPHVNVLVVNQASGLPGGEVHAEW